MPIEIKTRDRFWLRNSSPLFLTMKKWVTESKHGLLLTWNIHISQKIQQLTKILKNPNAMLTDKCVKVHEIAGTAQISSDCVHNILCEYFHMKKLLE